MSLLPSGRPLMSQASVATLALASWHQHRPGKALPLVAVLAIRAYYSKTFAPEGNNVGVYDDAMFILTPNGFSAWNANTDPSRYGWNPNAKKYMARLKPGVYDFMRLKHHASRPDGYMAFGQGPNPVTVERINEKGRVVMEETGCYGINLHRGGVNGTSSEGCLTIPSEQWREFDKELSTAIYPSNRFPLILIQQGDA